MTKVITIMMWGSLWSTTTVSPVIIDLGVGTYNAKTFSPQRYEIWTMQSAYHNLPTINGIQQKDGKLYKAEDVFYEAGSDSAKLSMNIAAAYPENAGLVYWKRTCVLQRKSEACITITDDFQAGENPPMIYACRIMTAYSPAVMDDPGIIELAVDGSNCLKLHFDPETLTAGSECIHLDDIKLKEVWG